MTNVKADEAGRIRSRSRMIASMRGGKTHAEVVCAVMVLYIVVAGISSMGKVLSLWLLGKGRFAYVDWWSEL